MGNIIAPAAALAAIAASAVVSPRRLYFKADEATIVEEGNPEAAFLAVGEGSQTSDPRVIEYLGERVPEILKAVAPVTPHVVAYNAEQSPTANQIALEARSPTDASTFEVAAIEAKEHAEGATPETEKAKEELPAENRGAAVAETPKAKPDAKPKAPPKPKASKPEAKKDGG